MSYLLHYNIFITTVYLKDIAKMYDNYNNSRILLNSLNINFRIIILRTYEGGDWSWMIPAKSLDCKIQHHLT